MANEHTLDVPRNLMASLRPLVLLLGVAAAVAAGVAVMLWWQGPNWSLLYGNLSARDTSEVVQALQTAGIQYKLNDASGAVMVPAEKVHEARLQLASQGLPESASAGLDLISKDSSFGVSQFMENARYQYALETELGRTIAALRGVEAARVHLAIPQPSAFVRDRRPPSASVLVQLRQGSRLESEQVSAIIHLVASSIPELDAAHVTVVDQQGRLLSAPDGGKSIATEQFEAAQRLEESFDQRIEQMLTPLVGADRVRAQTTVELDTGQSEEAREQYRPDSAIVRSEQTAETTTRAAAGGAGGVPGSLSNQPPSPGVTVPGNGPTGASAAPTAATAAAAASGAANVTTASATPESSSKQETRNFEIDRTLSYSRQPGGRVKRITVAVLLDNVHTVGADGKETATPLSAAQIEDITRLVKSAVGFDEARGDTVNVVNAAFRDETVTLTPETVPLWQRPWVMNAVRLGLGAVVLLALALGVLRPLLRNLTAPMLAATASGGAPLTIDAVAADAAPGSAAAAAVPGQPLAFEQQIVQARNLVTQDSKRVAQVVKSWVAES